MDKPKDAPPQIDRDDIERFLNERAPTTKCPSCDAGELVIIVDREDSEPLIGWSLFMGDSYRLPVFVQACKNCGFVFHFRVETVLRWLKEKKISND
jgi:hypothetical protein